LGGRRLIRAILGAEGVAHDLGSGFARNFKETDTGSGRGAWVVAIFAIQGGAAAVERADGDDGALVGEGFGAVSREATDAGDLGRNFRAIGPLGDGEDGEVVFLGEFDDGKLGIEEGVEELLFELWGKSGWELSLGLFAALETLGDGFEMGRERCGGRPIAAEIEVFGECGAVDVAKRWCGGIGGRIVLDGQRDGARLRRGGGWVVHVAPRGIRLLKIACGLGFARVLVPNFF